MKKPSVAEVQEEATSGAELEEAVATHSAEEAEAAPWAAEKAAEVEVETRLQMPAQVAEVPTSK